MTTKVMSSKKESNLDKKLFWPAIIFTIMILGAAVVVPDAASRVASAGMKWVTYDMGWAVQFGGLGCFIILMWLSFGKYGNVKLGAKKIS